MSAETNQNSVNPIVVAPIGNYRVAFEAECKTPAPQISTGMLPLDISLNGGLSNELYILGAETSTGKSAFLMSVAQTIAANGTDVLYFSLEMGKKEFVARGISAISYERHRECEERPLITASDVLQYRYEKDLQAFTIVPFSRFADYSEEYFMRYGEHLYIVEPGPQGITVDAIVRIAQEHKQQTNRPLVVFVDYLQLIAADPNNRAHADRKSKTDYSVATLKALASQVGMPVLTISSLARASYNGNIKSSSFKESGDIEYTGGILMGWNWHGVTNTSNENNQRMEKEACKTRGYRRIFLEVLKQRNGVRDNGVWIHYYSAYNYFEEGTEPKPTKVF